MAYPPQPEPMAYPSMQAPHDPTDVLGRRFGAYFIDIILQSAVALAIFAATRSESYHNVDQSNACEFLRSRTNFSGSCLQFGSRVYTWTGGRFALAIVLSVAAVALNQVVLQGGTGASVGKMMVGLRVVDEQGRTCGVGRAFVRWILLFVDSFFCGLVGLITVLVTHPHRRVGDMAAGTYVIGVVDAGKPVVMPPPSPVYAGVAAGGWRPPEPGAPGQPSAQYSWGQAPEPGAQPWATPAPPAQTTWGGTPPGEQPPPATWGQPPPPAWGAPPPRPPDASSAPAPAPAPEQSGWAAPGTPPPPLPDAPSSSEQGGESWWNKAVSDDATDAED